MAGMLAEFTRLLAEDDTGQPLGKEPSLDPLMRDFSCDWSAERVALQGIYGADFLPFGNRQNIFHIRLPNGETDRKRQVQLYFVIPMDYPSRPCIVEVEPNLRLTRKQTDILYTLLAEEVAKCIGMPMVFNLCTAAEELLLCLDRGDKVVMSLLAERGLGQGDFCSMFVDVDLWDPDEDEGPGPKPTRQIDDEMRLFTPTQFTGPISHILGLLPPYCEVIHIENVMRRDLATRFDRQHLAFYHKYVSTRRGSRLDANRHALSAITMAFHGTQPQNMHSIVREGLVVPGPATGVQVASGMRYGQGIYLSPDSEFSMRYCRGGGKLLVCAILLGVQWRCSGETYGMTECRAGYDSHVSPCGKELIVFNEAQVLPCFVIHHREKTAYEVKVQKQECVQNQILSQEASDHDRRKRLTAIARKQLPFGYGPGSHFEVLEIAPVDEDDEEYGDYQALLRQCDQEDEYQPSVHAERELQHVVG